MSIHSIFPETPFTDTEEEIVIQCMQTPALQKYLRKIALEDTKELLALSAVSTDPDRIARAHATIQGKLQVIATLLSIAEVPTT